MEGLSRPDARVGFARRENYCSLILDSFTEGSVGVTCLAASCLIEPRLVVKCLVDGVPDSIGDEADHARGRGVGD